MGLKFLLGYVFEPTDQVLIEHYLLKKMTGEILTAAERSLVSECNLYSEEGLQEAFQRIQELEDEDENDDVDHVRETSLEYSVPSLTSNKELFFFTPLRKKSHNGNRIDRLVGRGTWKGLDKGHPILDAQGRLIGTKKTFNYENKGSPEHLQWDMKEYCLDGVTLQNPNIKVKDYVICKIKRKARVKEKKRVRVENQIVGEKASQSSRVGAVPFSIEKQIPKTAKIGIFDVEDDHDWILSNISFDDYTFEAD